MTFQSGVRANRAFCHFSSALALTFVAWPLAAQEQARDTARVTPVVVSATRIPLSQRTLPVAVTVITAEELRVRGITTVADALTDVSSASVVQSGSAGATTSLFLRGGESKYVKVLIDGVPANDPGGSYDFASLTTDNVERIEIVRGPASVVHGADAVTGVVHVITRRGAGKPRTELDVRGGMASRERVVSGTPQGGAMQTLDATVALTGAIASGSYSMAVARHQTTGLYEQNNDFQNNVLSGRAQFVPAEGTELRLSLRYNDYKFNYPTDGGGGVSDRNVYRVEDRTIIGVEGERRFSSTLRAVLALSSSVNDGGTDDQFDLPDSNSFVSHDKTRRRGAEVRFHLAPVANTSLTFGAQVEQQDNRSQFQSYSAFGPFNALSKAARHNRGGYAEVVVSPIQPVTATAGVRVDDNQQFGTFETGRVGVSWRPVPATRLRATAGTAFREPSFFENFSTGFVVGNPNLKPERTTSWDAGVEQDLLAGRAQLIVNGFAQRFVNMIDYESTGSACGYSYCNVAEATSNGVELEGRAQLRGPFWASVGATFLKTKVAEPGFDSGAGGLYRRGQPLIRRPERKVTGELSYRGTGGLSASARVLAVGVREDRDFRGFPPTPVMLPSYERVDIAGEYVMLSTAATRSAATFRIENLGDRRYQNAFNFLAPRRTVSLGVRASF
jgi:vitamin B12 transporter